MFGVGGCYLFADEYVGEGLVAVEKTTIIIQEEIIIELLRDVGCIFYLGQQVLSQGLLLGVHKDSSLLE